MVRLNEHYQRLQGSYLFSEIASRVSAFKQNYPDADIIRMGIGDVTQPLIPAVTAAMHRAVDEMGVQETFRGYGPEQGYDFLREAIAAFDYRARGMDIGADELFVSDGSKCDVGNIQELLSERAVIAVTDPVYPVYVDTNVMAGRAGVFDAQAGRYERIVYLPCTKENGFVPDLPQTDVDAIYLCYPNNPTGTTLTKPQLARFVEYARSRGVLLLYDSAYEAYITEDVPHSIYEIDGAREVAIEFRSLSKTAGFTGTRCAYTVVPKTLFGTATLHDMWNRRHTTKFNGVSYITQRGAEAIYTPEGRAQVRGVIDYYMENARIIRQSALDEGFDVFGGVNAPYIWLKTPVDSWPFFDHLLAQKHIVGTPGAGFGRSGEGYFRLTAFSTRENTLAAVQRGFSVKP